MNQERTCDEFSPDSKANTVFGTDYAFLRKSLKQVLFEMRDETRATINSQNKMRLIFKEHDKEINALPIRDLITATQLLTSQSASSKIENRILKEMRLQKVLRSTKRGDGYDCTDGSYWEIKYSVITDLQPVLNLLQIRPHHKINGYLIFAFDLRSDPYTLDAYRLTKDDMENKEFKLLNVASAHNSKEDNRGNPKAEFVLRLSYKRDQGNYHLKRWEKDYAFFPDFLK